MEASSVADQLKLAIDSNNLEQVQSLMSLHPDLHRAPLGYANDGPLTWAAECRVPWEPPSSVRLAMVRWMVENGSDIHRGGDAPLMRAALNSDRIPMMELLVSLGADVNAFWHGSYPILFAPCEALNPRSLQWLLQHGADPAGIEGTTALDYLIGGYVRNATRLRTCLEILLQAGATTRYNQAAVQAILLDRIDRLEDQITANPGLIHHRFPELDFGTTGERLLTLRGATLLHVAAEYGNLSAVRLLLQYGADVNSRAGKDENGLGGQTPIFHSATQFEDAGLEVTRLLLEHGADLTLKATVPGHYERPGETLHCTPKEYAYLFPSENVAVLTLLSAAGEKS